MLTAFEIFKTLQAILQIRERSQTHTYLRTTYSLKTNISSTYPNDCRIFIRHALSVVRVMIQSITGTWLCLLIIS